jgi:hypothetical protein
MKWFRNRVVNICFLIIVGGTFLNMSFFLAEISLLKDAYNKTTIENIAKMFSASLAEEEMDAPESSEGGISLKEVDLFQEYHHHLQLENHVIANILKSRSGHSALHSGFGDIFTPPPDRAIFC